MIDSFNSLDQLATKRANTTTKPDIDRIYAEKPTIKVLVGKKKKGKIKGFNFFLNTINTDAYPNSIAE
jgi:hypothetical protein